MDCALFARRAKRFAAALLAGLLGVAFSARAAGPVIVADSTSLLIESCGPANGAIDPGESVTVSFSLKNTGTAPTTDLIATLLSTNGVLSPSSAQSYGSLVNGGLSVGRSFSFIASGPCGATIIARFRLQDGATDLGEVTFSLRLGRDLIETRTFANSSSISIPTFGVASPYPSTISVSSVAGYVTKVTVALNNMSHTFPSDVDILMAGPAGGAVVLMSDAGSGGIQNVTVGFDDAGAILPQNSQILSSTYAPTNYQPNPDGFAAPAPAPNSTALSVFNGANPNGTWQLFVSDDANGDSGTIAGGWSVSITTTNFPCCVNPAATDLAVSVLTTPNPVYETDTWTQLVTVSNKGPATATSVMVTNRIPAGMQFVSANTLQGSCSVSGGNVICNFGTLAPAATANAAINLFAPAPATVTIYSEASAAQVEPNITDNVATSTLTILALPGLTVSDAAVTEGNAGQVNAVFNVTLSASTSRTVTFDYFTANGSAITPGDYAIVSSAASFSPGQTATTVTIPVNGDTTPEFDETFFVHVANLVNAKLVRSPATGTILNDDPPILNVNDITITEGNSGIVTALFNLTLSPTNAQTATVNYSTVSGTASAGSDYLAVSGTATFPPGTASQTISVTINGDLLNESDETFFLNLSSPANLTLARSQAVGTISNDDAIPALSINNASVTEGNNGTVNAVFTVSLSVASGQTITVQYGTANGSAFAGSDYSSVSGTLTFSPGTTSQTISVAVNGDFLNEPNETFFVDLGSPINATLAQSSGTGTIQNDDPTPSITISDTSVTEGNSGTASAVFNVTLSVPSGQTVTVQYGTADGTAVIGADYFGAGDVLAFAPGTTNQTIEVLVKGDTLNEADETVLVNLSNPVNATVARSQAAGTIVNDDPLPTLTIDDASAAEGNFGTANPLFTVTLSQPSGRTITVNYATADGTALATSDYTSASGILTFPAGSTEQSLAVAVSGDLLNELDETFFVDLSAPSNATIARSRGIGTIANDDPIPVASVNDVTIVEGNSGTANAVFTFTLSAPSSFPISVNYATANGTATSAGDYTAISGIVNFPAGSSIQTIGVAVTGETFTEADETFFLNLSNPTNATLARNQVTTTIINDDAVPTLSINDVSLTEGNASSVNFVFTVNLSAAAEVTVTAQYATADNTAVAGSDYSSASGTVSFPPGSVSQTISVSVTGDALYEPDETFLVNLSNPANALFSRNQGIGTIQNDEALPSITVNDVSVTEGNSGTVNATFPVTLSGASAQPVTIQYAVANETAQIGADYGNASGTLTFALGTTSQSVTVPVNGDVLDESDETFLLNLSNPSGATLARTSATGTILDDDALPALSINDVSVFEGNSGTVNAVFTVNLSPMSGRTVSANYATANNTAIAGTDYTAASGTVTFSAGTTAQTISVPVQGDTTFEVNKSFFVNLSSPVNVTVTKGQGIGTIVDDESKTVLFTNSSPLTIPAIGAAGLYPSTIEFSGVPGQISKATVTVVGITHTFSDDIDILLVGPAGQKVLLMSDAGGANSLNNVQLTFDDSAAGSLPDSSQITSSTFKPSNFFPNEELPSPAPSSPYATALSALSGSNPNGTWSLYVADDTDGDSGSIASGWRLAITTTNLVCCVSGTNADISVTMSDSPDPVLTFNNLTYSFTVINSGPAAATGVKLTNTFPSSATFVSSIVSQGTSSRVGNVVTFTIGNLAVGGSATASVVVSPQVGGSAASTASAGANETDSNLGNNQASVNTTVNLSPPTISINDITVTEGNVGSLNAVFTVSLSRVPDNTVTVSYATASGTATAGVDYDITSETLTFPPGVSSRTISVPVYGDVSIEANETFFVNLSSPVNATIADSQGICTINNNDGLAGQVDRFTWGFIGATQSINMPFPVTVTAVDPGGSTVSGFSGTVSLDGLIGAETSQSILITEIDAEDDVVEFANITAFPFDISGWEVVLYDWFSWPDPLTTFVFPSGTVCPAGGTFVLRDNGGAPGAYPNFFLGLNLSWLNEDTNNQVAIMLRNSSGQAIDFFCAVDGFSSEISLPFAISSSQWQGNPVIVITNTVQTYQRTGNVDHNNSSDWNAATESIGTRNSGLTIPFPGPAALAVSPSTSANFVSGVWSGNITVLQLATNMNLRANDGNGHKGLSGTFTVKNSPMTDLSITNLASPPLLKRGDPLTYTLIVSNSGPLNASSVVVTNTLPASVSFVSASSSLGTVNQSGNIVIANIGTLASNAAATVAILVTPTTSGTISNSAVVMATEGDANQTNNFSFALTLVNFPPVISAISNQTILEDSTTGQIGFTVSDVESAPATITLSAKSSNPTLVPDGNISTNGTGGSRNVTVVPTLDRSGVATISLIASDGLEMSTNSFVLTVTSVNDGPSFTKGVDQTTLEDSGAQTIAGWATATSAGPPEESAQTLTFVVTNSNNALFSAQPAVSPTGTLTYTPALNANGNVIVSVTLRDNGGTANGGIDTSAAQTFSITIGPVNDAPSFVKGADQSVAEDSGSRTVPSWAVAISPGPGDEAGQTVTFVVTNSNPTLFSAQPTISPAGTLSFTPATNGNGSATVTVTLRDNGGTATGGIDTSAAQTFTISVTLIGDAPVLSIIATQTVNELSTLLVTNTATDADLPTDTLTFSLDPGAPSGATIDPVTGVFSWTPTEAQGPGTYIVTVRVTDGSSLSDAKSFTVIVNEMNAAPALIQVGNQNVNEGSTLSLGITATDTDQPANALTFALISSPSGASIDPSTGLVTWTPTEAQGPANISLTVLVIDNGLPALSNTMTFSVTVNEVNAAPALTPIANQNINEGSTLSIGVTASDTDVPANILTYSLVSPPSGANINPSTGLLTWTPSEAQGPTNISLTVRVVDNGSPALSNSISFTVTVNEVNTAPTLPAIANQIVNEGVTLSFNVTATDADLPANTLTYTLTSAPTGASINPTTGAFTWTPTEAQGPGTFPITVRVSDNALSPSTDSKTFNVTVNEVNGPPTLGTIANQTINEGATLSFGVTATDPDVPVNTLTYSLSSAPSGANINPTTGAFTWTPTEAQGPGTYPITVQVSDNASLPLSDSKTFNVIVNEANNAPTLGTIANQTVNEGSTLSFIVSASDSDVPANTLTFSLISSPGGASIDPPSGVFTWTPAEAQGPSTNSITVRVTDSGGLTDTKNFTAVVNEVNSPPAIAAIPDQSVNEGGTLSFTIAAGDADIPGNSLTYSLPSAPPGATINSSSGLFTWTPTEGQGPSTNSITVQVTDNGSPTLNATATFTVLVGEVNTPPVLTPVANQTINEGNTLTLGITATDSDVPGNGLTYSLSSAPVGASINPTTGVFTWTPTEAQGPSTSSITVQVIDNGSPALNATTSFTVTVNEVNAAPVLGLIGSQNVNEGGTLSFTVTATDSDFPANVLTYSLVSPPAGASMNPSTGLFTWTPTEAQGPTNVVITVRVADNGSPALSNTTTFAVNVNEVNNSPTLAAIANQTINEGATLSLSIVASDSDIPVNVLSYSLLSAPSGASINPTTGLFTWTPTEAQGPTNALITVRVVDNGGLSDTKNFNIAVNEVNSSPLLAAIATQTINEGTTLSLTVSATDSDIPANALTYSLLAAPSGASINPTTGLFTWTPTEAQGPSTNTVFVEVVDNGSPSANDLKEFTIVVNEQNSAPSLAAIADRIINESTTLSFTVTATDPDSPVNVLTYSIQSGPAGASISASSGLFTWSPSEAQGPSTNVITIRVTDNGSPTLSDLKNFTVTVNEVNSPPTLAAIADQSINEGSTLSFAVSASDSDLPGNTLTYSLITAPSGASINPSSGVLTWTPSETQGPGTNPITVQVSDSGGLTDSKTFNVSVHEVNLAPTLAVIADATVNEGATLSFSASASDPDLPANTLTYTLVSPPNGASIDPATGLFTWTPTEAQGPSTNQINVRVTDSGASPLSDTKTFAVFVTEVNRAPVLSVIADQTINEGATLSFSASATDPDVPANTLTYSLISSPPVGANIDPVSGVFTWTPTETQGPNTTSITVQVRDNGGLTDSKTFNVVVNEVNLGPTLNTIADRTVNEGSTLSFTITATDPDVPANLLTYSLVSPPSGASINPSTGVFTWTPGEGQGPSTNTINVRVADNAVSPITDTKTFVVVVNEVNNRPTLAIISDQSINEGGTLSFTVSATDSDIPVNALTYTLSNAPVGASINALSGVFTWTPTEGQGPGTNQITVIVTDNGVPPLNDSKSFNVTVNEVNSAPSLAVITDKSVNEGAALSFTATASDPDVPANVLVFSIVSGPIGASIDPSSGAFTWTPTEAQGPGSYPVTLRVADAGGLSDSKNFNISVNEVNTAPVLTAVGNQSVSEGATLNLNITATDPDVPANILTYSLVSPPAGASINSASGAFTWTPIETQGPTNVVITVRVVDNGSPALSNTMTFSVTVSEVNSAPLFATITDRTVNEGSTLSFTISASDSDVPVNALTFSLVSPPSGAGINASSGLFTWTPGEAQGPSTNSITVRVTDNGSPPANTTTNFTVIVNESNSAPSLAVIANQSINENATLTLTAVGSDSDLPANVLTYSLQGTVPAGASINPSSGVFTWTPTEAQGPSVNSITVQVTDDGSPPLSASRTFTVTVNQINTAPVMPAIADKTIKELSTLSFAVSATDSDIPANTLTYSLLGTVPSGASINASSGVFTWTPTAAQGPSTNPFNVRVVDNGAPPLSATNKFTVIVNELNSAPVLQNVTEQTVNEGSALVVTNTAIDVDIPANLVTYSLLSAPAGASIDPSSGVFIWTPTEGQGPSTNQVMVQAMDNGSPPLGDTRTFIVIVNEVNTAPALNPIANQSVNEGATLSFAVSATDADIPANAFTYALVSPPSGASINPSTGVFTWTPTEAQGPNTVSITVRVIDNGSPALSNTMSFAVSINEVNFAPTITPIANRTNAEGSTLSFTVSASDPDVPANSLSYSLTSAPPGASIDASSGVFTWTPTESQGPSANTITVQVTDNGLPSQSATANFQIIVTEANTPPTLPVIATQTINEGSPLNLNLTASDPDVPLNTLTYSLITAPVGASINSANGQFSWTPTEAQGPSTNTITVRVTDNGSGSDTKSITVLVNEVNSPPTLATIADQAVNEGGTLAFTITASDPDIPGNVLTYVLSSSLVGASINPSSGVFTWTPTEAQGPSTNLVLVDVIDSGGLSDSKIFTIVVNEVNGAPTVAVIADQTVAEGTTLRFTIAATDPDLPANVLTYALLSPPAGANINPNTGVFTWTPGEGQGPSTNTITVRVTDNAASPLSSARDFKVFVTEQNNAPSLAVIAGQTINEGGTLSFTITATDSDVPANTLTYTLLTAPTGATLNPTTGLFTWTPTEAQGPSTNSVIVEVVDNGLPSLSDIKEFTITVNEVNSPPVLGIPATQTVSEGGTLRFTISATDPDIPSNPLTYALVSPPSGANINPNTGVFTWTPTEGQGPSTNQVTVRVTDQGGLNDTRSFLVLVDEVNSPPTLAFIADQSINEGGTLSFTVAASDLDIPGNILTFSLSSAPNGASINPVTGVFTWTPTEAQGPGTNAITVQVSDNASTPLSDSKTFMIVVNEVNNAPTLATVPDRVINEQTSLTINLSATDPDLPANILTYSILAGPAGASVNPSSGVFTWTPTEAQGPSTNVITVRVTDDAASPLSNTKNFTVIVNEVNRPPVALVIADKTIKEGNTLSFVINVTDPDLPPNSLTYRITAAPIGAAVDVATGLFTWTPTADQGPSTNQIIVNIADNGGLDDFAVFTVIVNEVNSAPVLETLPQQFVNEGGTLIVTNKAVDVDIPANILTYSLLSAPPGSSINVTNGVFTWTPTEAQGPSTNVVMVQVTDNGLPPLNDAKSFNVIVNEVNAAPTLSAIPNQTVNEGATLSFTATAADPDAPANVLTFSIVLGPSGANIDPSSGLFTWTPTEAQGPGSYPVTVQVADAGGLSDARNFTVAVNEVNTAPTLAVIGNQTVSEGATLSVNVTATDPDVPSNVLTYSLVSPPSGASINASSGAFTWTPTEAQGPSNVVITVRVVDNGSPALSNTMTFSVTVSELNSAPVFAAIADRTVNEGSALSFTVSATDSDVPGNTLTYSLVSAPSGASVNPSSGMFSWTPTEAQGPSTNVITVRATDNGSPALNATANFTVIVNEVNLAPALAAIANQSVNENSTLSFTVAASDPDLPANVLAFSLVSPPAGASINAASGLFTWTPTETQGPSTNVITVQVVDSGSPALSATTNFTVVVNQVNTAPVLPAIADKTIKELSTLSFAVSATDSDIPANTLTYNLQGPVPSGASINASSGVFTWTPTAAQGPSTNLFTVRVVDNGVPPLSATTNFTVIVNELNSAPVLQPIAEQMVNEGSTLLVTNRAIDVDVPVNVVTYALLSGPPGMSLDASSGVLTWTPTEVQGPSTNEIIVQATDNGVPPLTDTRSFTVIVNEVNTAPVLTPIANQSVNEGVTLSLTVSTTDVDVPANAFTYALVSPPSGATINPITGVFTWTPSEAQGPNTISVTVRVIDNGSPTLSNTTSFAVTIGEVNVAPSIVPIADRTIAEGGTVSFTVSANDPDIPANALSYSLVTAPPGASINAASGLFTWTPTEAQGPSTNAVTVRVADNGASPLSATASFQIVVTEVNTPPTLPVIANQTINEGTPLNLSLAAIDPDVPANILSYVLITAPPGASINSNGQFTWTPNEAQGPSTNTVTVQVTDGSPASSDTKTFTVFVNEVNSQPVFALIGDKTIKEGNTLSFLVSAVDPDVPANVVTYSLESGPRGVTVNPASGQFTWTPTPDQGPSTNTIVIRAVDNAALPLDDFAIFQVIVNEGNSTPALAAIADQTVNEGSTLTFTVTASDPDVPVNILTYTLSSPLSGASVNPTTGVFTWTPGEAQGPSTNQVTVQVTDNGVPPLSDSKSFKIVVNEVNSTPTIGAISDRTVSEAATLSFIISATDPDSPANALIYTLDSPPSGATINPSSGLFTWTPSEGQGPNSYAITVRVTDNGSPTLSASRNFNVAVSEVNNPPMVSAIADQSVNEGGTLSFSVGASDPDIPANALTYSLVSPPSGASINSGTGVFTWTPTEVQGPSTNQITVRVTDNGSPALSASSTFTVIVREVNLGPSLTLIADRTVNENSPVSFTVTASDPDLPANKLSFSIVAGPAGAGIDSASGVFTWAPTEAQGPGTNLVTVRVSDDASSPLSQTRSFTVVVNELNSMPLFSPIADKTIKAGSALSFVVSATDPDVPVNTLTYSLLEGPVGASINAASGLFMWTPTLQQGGTTNSVLVSVVDNGNPALDDFASFRVIVSQGNSTPVLGTIDNRNVNEGGTLNFTVTATDPDVPANVLTYSLLSAPPGASINAASGVFTWTPSEAQGPSTNVIQVRVTDNGVPSLTDSRTFTVFVNEVNTPPTLLDIPDQSIVPETALTLTIVALDMDVPANTLTFNIDSGPAGAVIDPVLGDFVWQPSAEQTGSYTVVLRVTDNGSGSLFATNHFVIRVSAGPSIADVKILPDGRVELTCAVTRGKRYQLQATGDEFPWQWQNLGVPVTADTDIMVIRDSPGDVQSRFYRLVQLD